MLSLKPPHGARARLEAPDPAQKSQGSGAFILAWKDRLGIQQDIDLGAVNLGDAP
jgi:hypothetical protein